MPPKVKSYQNLLRPVAEMFARYAPDKEIPLTVMDASTELRRRIWLVLLWTVNDIRGVPGATMGRAPPCYIGPCNCCKIPGMRPCKLTRTVMPGAVRALCEGLLIAFNGVLNYRMIPYH